MGFRNWCLPIALALACAALTPLYAMTCNIARAYNRESTLTMPIISRQQADLIFNREKTVELFAFPRYRPATCQWSLSRNGLYTPLRRGTGEVQSDQSVKISIPTAKLEPGFYDLDVHIGDTLTESEDGRATFGWRIADMPIAKTRPADFDDFWRKAVQRADATPLNADETFVCSMTDAEISKYNETKASIPADMYPEGKRADKVSVYKIRFDAPGGRRMTAWLAVPAGAGPFPGLAVFPGAGNAPLPMPVEHARHGYVSLMLQIHGLDVDGTPDTYKAPTPGYLRYISSGYGEQLDQDYYYGVILACVQAIRYLESRPEVDGKRLAVAGASQGGMLSLVTAALCPEVKAAVSYLCYHSDFPYRDFIGKLNAAKSAGDTFLPPVDMTDPRTRYQSYFDVMNFAPRVKGAVLMNACLCDTPSPVTTVYAVYRNLGAGAHRMLWSPGLNHDLMVADERQGWQWLDAVCYK